MLFSAAVTAAVAVAVVAVVVAVAGAAVVFAFFYTWYSLLRLVPPIAFKKRQRGTVRTIERPQLPPASMKVRRVVVSVRSAEWSWVVKSQLRMAEIRIYLNPLLFPDRRV